MQLAICGDRVIDNPTGEGIAQALAALPGGDADSFAVLSASDQFYVQCLGSAAEGFDLEYRDGNDTCHFRATGGPLTLAAVTQAFQRYNTASLHWNDGLQFERLDLSARALATYETPPEREEPLIEKVEGVYIISRKWGYRACALGAVGVGIALWIFVTPFVWPALRRLVWDLGAVCFVAAIFFFVFSFPTSAEKRGFHF